MGLSINIMQNNAKKAFTIVELLVVIGIISLLMAILMPALNRAREQARGVLCLTKIRQLVIASYTYANNHNDYYPVAYRYENANSIFTAYAWDFTSIKDWTTRETKVIPGLLWQGETIAEIQQCPSFDGGHNWLDDPYTGYNYNTSYIGHGSGESITTPAKITDVRRPSECAIFGDGEYGGGANKFMRAPLPSEGDDGFFGRAAGTQGYRHLGRTNVAYCDGSAKATRKLYTNTDLAEIDNIAQNTGFLSSDNSAYDLK